MNATRALLAGLIDYAGLFPPAGLAMAPAFANHLAYRRSPVSWLLGRFVIPAARLVELTRASAPLVASDEPPVELSVLLGADDEGDLATTAAFAREHGARFTIAAFETPAASADRISALAARRPAGSELFCELPLEADLPALAAACARAGVAAKVRTGGVRAEDFPAPSTLLSFLEACRDARIPWKATAGLHHPVRGEAPLTDEPASPCATMFGYLNVVLAATALWAGRTREEALALLDARDRAAISFGAERIAWGESAFEAAEIALARRQFCRSIGSCSFTEPVAEVRGLGAEV